MEKELSKNPALEEELPQKTEENALQDTPAETEPLAKTRYGQSHTPIDHISYQLSAEESLNENLLQQLSYLSLPPTQYKIGKQIIGSLDENGYLRRALSAIQKDLLLNENLRVQEDDVAYVLEKIQQFEPAGIATKNLQECLIAQVKRFPSSEIQKNALTILDKYYEAFTLKHFHKLTPHIPPVALQEAFGLIKRLNPKPGEQKQDLAQPIYPDFIITLKPHDISVHMAYTPRRQVRIAKNYLALSTQQKRQKKTRKYQKEVQDFLRKQVEDAQGFLRAMQQRDHSLIKAVKLIATHQRDFLQEGDEKKLKPLILKDIAEKIHMDISTISRMVNRKYVQTHLGIFSLKRFFSQAIHTPPDAKEVSQAEIKEVLKQLIRQENPLKPMTDENLVNALKEKNYAIARRTVAKYREFLKIPIARLRKKMP